MNDCLLLPLAQGVGPGRPLGGWEGVWETLGEGEANGLPQGGGTGWEPVQVPLQQAARQSASCLWYRARFPRPDHAGRVLLRFGGAFLAANVWLNGRLLGSHYGYFGAFGFDITPFLKDENLVVIACESPIETDLSRKRHVMGQLNDGQGRPYPPSAFFSLPDTYQWEVPLGLWRPVELVYTGPVCLDWVRLKPRLETHDTGRLEVEARLRNLDGRAMHGELAVEVLAPPGEGGRSFRLRREFRLAGGTEQTLGMVASVPQARPWSPWRLGDASLYEARVTVAVNGVVSTEASESFGFRQASIHAAPDGWRVEVNGKPMFLRGANYAPQARLDLLTDALMRSDLELAKAANLDLLRVHAHVLPEGFYRLADQAGMLVFADFPLTLSYAYHASADDSRFFDTAVREQVPEFISLLQNRPSVILYSAHDDPPWIAANAALADVHAVRQNYTIDQEAKALMESLDPSRTALAASGEFDSHLWLGWRSGSWADFQDHRSAFASEFGAQALPSADSPALAALGGAWPISGEDPRWLYAGLEPAPWAERGAGLPTDYDSLERYIEASQAYQGYLVRFAIDQLRKRKFEPCWGAVVYELVDPFPGVGFGIADSARHPRVAYEAVKEAMAALRVVIDPVGFVPVEPWGVGFVAGHAASLRLVVVNDDFAVRGEASLRWAVWRNAGPERQGLGRLKDAVQRKSFSGSVNVDLPTAYESALQACVVSLPLTAQGDWEAEVELRVPGRPPAVSRLEFRVVATPVARRPTPLLPRFLAERLLVPRSLAADGSGLKFTLHNRTRPAELTGVRALRLDGRPLSEPAVFVDSESGRVPMPRRLELPVGRELDLLVDLGAAVVPGEHSLEIELALPGLATGRAVLEGEVKPEDTGSPSHR